MEDHQDAPPEQGEAQAENADAFAGLLEESLASTTFKRGDIVEGTVVSKEPGEVLVDIGGKAEAVISRRELEQMGDQEMGATSQVGGGQSHENMPPFLCINFIFALNGIFPSEN